MSIRVKTEHFSVSIKPIDGIAFELKIKCPSSQKEKIRAINPECVITTKRHPPQISSRFCVHKKRLSCVIDTVTNLLTTDEEKNCFRQSANAISFQSLNTPLERLVEDIERTELTDQRIQIISRLLNHYYSPKKMPTFVLQVELLEAGCLDIAKDLGRELYPDPSLLNRRRTWQTS